MIILLKIESNLRLSLNIADNRHFLLQILKHCIIYNIYFK